MVTAWLLACLRPSGPYPVLVLYGEQGSAKSTAARALRSFADPHTRPLRACPRTDRDLAAAVQNNWLVGLDNVSSVRDWLSDSLCQVATGAGFSGRELYTDFEEVGVGGARPVVLNGITPQMISRPDLLDRCLMVGLPVIGGGRLTEVEVNRRLEAARPGVLAGLLGGVSAGLRNRGRIELPPLPRMADFAAWAEECGEGLGWPRGGFCSDYRALLGEQNLEVLGGWSVYDPLCRLLEAADGEIRTKVAGLLTQLQGAATDLERAGADWPRTPRGLGEALRRHAVPLREAGIRVEFPPKRGDGHPVRVSRIGDDGHAG